VSAPASWNGMCSLSLPPTFCLLFFLSAETLLGSSRPEPAYFKWFFKSRSSTQVWFVKKVRSFIYPSSSPPAFERLARLLLEPRGSRFRLVLPPRPSQFRAGGRYVFRALCPLAIAPAQLRPAPHFMDSMAVWTRRPVRTPFGSPIRRRKLQKTPLLRSATRLFFPAFLIFVTFLSRNSLGPDDNPLSFFSNNHDPSKYDVTFEENH